MKGRILIAGVGNIFLGDDAFGGEVVRELARRAFPEGVRIVDFGIRGLDLTYALLDGYEVVILVDAVPRGGTPGDLYLIEPELTEDDSNTIPPPMIEAHNLDPARVLGIVRAMGGRLERVLVVGCEPTPLASEEEMHMGLSEPVQASVGEAVKMIEAMVAELLEPSQR